MFYGFDPGDKVMLVNSHASHSGVIVEIGPEGVSLWSKEFTHHKHMVTIFHPWATVQYMMLVEKASSNPDKE